jgi:multiple sugar transport system substrate-binding protein
VNATPSGDGALNALSAAASSVSRRSVLKFGAGALALGASSALLSACSTNNNKPITGAGSAKEIEFWNFYGPAPKANPQSQWFVDIVDDWNSSHDVKVKLRYIANADYVSGNVLQSAFASGKGPDIFLLSPGDFLRYYNGGVLQELTPHIKKDVIADFLPGTLDTRKVGDKIFAIPMESEPLALYYSKAAFSEIGITDANLPKTWADVLSVAKELTNSKRFGLMFETTPGFYQNFTWYPFMWQGDGAPVNGKKATFDSDPVHAALKFWGDSISSGVAPRKPLGTGGGDAPANLASGYVAMQQTGIWGIADLRQQAPDFEYGIMPLPTPPGGKPTSIMGGWAFTANAKGGNPEAAAEFIAWAMASSSKDSIERGRVWDTVAKSDIPVRQSVLDAAKAKGAFDDPNMKFFADVVAPTGRGEPRYPPQIIKAIEDAIQGVQLGGQPAAAAAATAQATISQFISSYNGASIL